ncbi:hypothetical protein [Mycoplasmopsis cynos]|uniref:hypothetical protein n=1 Tax=Mycoplasmopsis cynos TaxID=171284 RepID=UPI0022060489|nr:hypothetical protein [Mycoplasmopsis cynos]UWV92433.1 hypothetical protein NWE57_06290 [Mycoplasmopsis cynos]
MKQKLLDQIKHRNDKTNLIGQLSSASTLEQILEITKKIEKRVKEIAEAKQKLKDTVNKIPEKDNVSKDIKNKYKERLKNIDNAELSEINKIIEESELEIKRSQTRDYVDNLLGDSAKSENKKRGELITKLLDPNKSSTFATIDELKKEADEEFKKYKKSVIDRARKELLENAALSFIYKWRR